MIPFFVLQEFSAPLFIIPKDGFYILALRIQGLNFKADVEIRMLSSNGYLSAADWPLLPVVPVVRFHIRNCP